MKEISYKELSLNPMTLTDETWWLITAGNGETGCNTMTASWGHLGTLWGHGKDSATAIVYVRPQRYTKEFIDREERFTLSVMGDDYKKQLAYLGSASGRDGDKLAAMGMKPLFLDGTATVEGAEMVLVCKKLYAAPVLEEGFVEKDLVESVYPERDFHTMYVGRIEKVYVKE